MLNLTKISNYKMKKINNIIKLLGENFKIKKNNNFTKEI